MKKTKLSHAIAMAATGVALSMGAVSNASAASTTMYNMNTFAGITSTATDGWVWSDPANTSTGAAGPNVAANATTGAPAGGNFANYNSATRASNFVGTTPGTTPFGFNATSSLNWAVELGVAGDTAQISAADSLKYGSGAAEIDTGAGAWQDNSALVTNPTTGVTTGPTGWKHQTDIGLIKANQDMWVTLTPTVVDASGNTINFPSGAGNFGLTVFYGMDTNTVSYSHHGRWNCPSCSAGDFSYTKSNPFGTQNVWHMANDPTVDSSNPLTFFANAGLTYTVYLGGAGVGSWGSNLANYKLDVSTSPVPVPAAAWLFGGALMSLFGARRRKSVVPA